MKIMTVATAFVALALFTPAYAGGDLSESAKAFKGSALKFRLDSKGSCIAPLNWEYVRPHCPPGWVKLKARVNDLYWRKCTTKSWFASFKVNGITYCTQRFRAPEGEFCAPKHFTSVFTHKSPYDGNITAFDFKGNIRFVEEMNRQATPMK